MADAKTGPNTHRATERGYAVDPDSNAGVLVEEGEMVPAGIPVSETWMKPVKKGDRALAQAVGEALDPHPKDVDLTKLNLAALQALAAERGINPGSLSKKELVTAIKAAAENDAG